MARTKTIAGLLAICAGLSACGGVNQNVAPIANRSLDSLNQPVVSRTDYVLDLSAPGGYLAERELGRLEGWFESLQIGYGDQIWVEDSYGDPSRRAEIAKVAADYGLLLSDGAPVTAGAVAPDTVRVILTRSSATVPGCPNWDKADRSGRSATSPNYGCAVNSNMAAMVANPNDLVLGQAGSTTGDAATSAKAIKVYRDAAPTGTKGLTETKTDGGKQ